MTERATGWSNRAVRFVDDGKVFTGWRETSGGKTVVEVGKYAAAGTTADRAVPSRTKTVEDITIRGAFPAAQEVAVRQYFRRKCGRPIQYFDTVVNPDSRRAAGREVYRGYLKEMAPPAGGEGTSTDTAEIELVLTLHGTVGR